MDEQQLDQNRLQQERILAVNSIQNLMSRLVFYRLADVEYRCTELFANGDPGLKIQIPPGIFEGPDAAIRVYGDPKVKSSRAKPGELHFHTLVSPIIEVAGDGKTARALWMSPGAVSLPRGGTISAMWAWTKYAADYKKMDNGEWKIWHQRITTVFNSPYDKPWTEPGAMPGPPPGAQPGGGPPPGMPKADRPNPDKNRFSVTDLQELDIEPPTPYETWDDSMSCVR
jgi:hypothetical protein